MTEAHIGFLFNIASKLPNSETNRSTKLLKSYYLMKCKKVARGYGLPQKHFSSKARCPQCCMEWKVGTETKLTPIRLSKRQRRRIKSQKISDTNQVHLTNRKNLLHSNNLEQVCTFCKNKTVTPLLKPEKKKQEVQITPINISNNQIKKKEKLKNKKTDKKESPMNVYSSAKDVYSLQNKSNTLSTSVKETPKVIKNNKKKKDKFAGLCQQAVLQSAKYKEEKEKKNKLNLFLRPSL